MKKKAVMSISVIRFLKNDLKEDRSDVKIIIYSKFEIYQFWYTLQKMCVCGYAYVYIICT